MTLPVETQDSDSAPAPLPSARFYLLCIAERQPLYRKILEATPFEHELFDDPEGIVAQCVAVPPLALLVDLASSVRIGSFRMGTLANLEVTWPILRIKTIHGESPMVMSIDPPRRGALLETLRSIASGDPGWLNARFRRRYIRLKLTCRVRWRVDSGEWVFGNTLNISAGGGLIASYDPPVIGTHIEIEIGDLADNSFHLKGHVVRTRLWADSPEIPGFGVKFDTTDEGLSAALVHWFRRYAALASSASPPSVRPGAPSSWPGPHAMIAPTFSSTVRIVPSGLDPIKKRDE